MSETNATQLPEEEFIPAVILLTDNKPMQCKDIVWEGEATADYIPNYTDLRFPYKQSSLLCPSCGGTLTGTPKEIKEEEPEEDDKSRKPKAKRKPKPWEIYIENVRHEKSKEKAECPLSEILKNPHGKVMALIEACHQITWIRATQERASRTEDSRGTLAISSALLEKGNIPKLITSQNEEFEEETSNSSREELF